MEHNCVLFFDGGISYSIPTTLNSFHTLAFLYSETEALGAFNSQICQLMLENASGLMEKGTGLRTIMELKFEQR